MDIQRSSGISNFETLVKNMPNNEINSVIELLKNKISEDISGISTEIINLNLSLHAFNANDISDTDLLYLYCTVKQLSKKLDDTKKQLTQELSKIKNEYICSTCEKPVTVYPHQGLLVNLQNHTFVCKPCDSSNTCDVTNKILQLRECELYRQIHYDNLIKEQLFFKSMTNGDGAIYFYTIHILENTFLCLICACEFSMNNSTLNILQHVAGHKHVGYLNDVYSAVFNFHSYFAKLDPKYQLLQKKFSIVDDTKTKCQVCNATLNYKNLSKHVTLPVHSSSTVAIEPTDLVKYDEKILNSIYKDLLDWFVVIDNEKYPIIQNIDQKIYCIVCNTTIHKSIPNHTSSDSHKDNLSKDIILTTIKKYHKVWSVQPVHIQIEQVYFKRRDNKITCTLCSEFFSYNTQQLHDHVESINHKRFLVRATTVISPTSPDSKAQADTSKRKNNGSVLPSSNITSRSTSEEQTRGRSSSNCSATSSPKNVPGTLKTTSILSNSPISQNKESTTPKKLRPSSVSSSVNNDSPKKVPCLMDAPINMVFSPKKIPSLINTPINDIISPKKLPLANSTINTNISQTVKMVPYDESIFEDIYPDGLLHFTITIGFTKYPIIVKRGDSKFCFACNTDVTNSALLHANSQQHVESVKNENRQNCLKKFHHLWLNLPSTDQCRQNLFNAMDDLKCTVCNNILNYDVKELTSHLESWDHVQRLMSSYSNNDVDRNDDDQVYESHDDIVDKIVKGVEDRLDVRVEKLIDIDDNSEADASKSIDLTEDIFKFNKKSLEKIIFKPDFVAYPKEILDDLYGNELVNYNVCIANTRYPFIQSMGSYARCLLCGIDIIGSVLLHMNSANHTVLPKKFGQLKQYHDLWIEFPASDQREQKFFDIGDTMTCYLCEKQLKYEVDDVNTHIYSLKHQNESWSVKKIDSVGGAAMAEYAINEMNSLCLNEENDAEKMQNISLISTEDVSITFNSTVDMSMENDNTATAKPRCTSNNKNYDWEYSYRYSQELNCVKYYIASLPDDSIDVVNSSGESDTEMETTVEVLQDYSNDNYEDEFIYKRDNIQTGKGNELFCLICDRTVSNYDHSGTKKHIKKVSNATHPQRIRINVFLSLWNDIDKKFAHMKGGFMIVADNIAFCMTCGLNIEYYMLQEHLERFHQGYVCPIKDKLYENFKAPGTQYSKEIRSKIFQYSIPQLNIIADSVSYPIIQTTIEGMFCLLCKSPVVIDLMEHLNSPRHIMLSCGHTHRRKVYKYHGAWNKLDATYQKQMLYFHNQSSCSFYCMLCKVDLGRNKLKTHLFSEAHTKPKMPQENVYENESAPLVQNAVANIYEGVYCADELYPRLTNDFVRKENNIDIDIIQATSLNNFACLICHVQTVDVVKHISKIKHIIKLTVEKENIVWYHKEWAKLDPKFQYLQTVFYPISPTITFCTFCSLNVEYVKLMQHLERCHNNQEDLEFKDKLDDNFVFQSKKEYYPNVLKTLYKDNIPQCNIIIEMVSYPVIQTLEKNTRCLLCYKSLTESVYDHLNSEDHSLNALQIFLRTRLKNYHDTWLDGDEDFQMQQAYFERDGDVYYCKICRRDLKSVNLREHIVFDNHESRLEYNVIKEKASGNSISFHDIEIASHSDSVKVNVSQVSDDYITESEDAKTSEEHIIRKSVENAQSRSIIDRVPFRYNDHKHFLMMDNLNNVFCSCCSKKLKHEMSNIKEHFDSPSHLRKSNVPRKKMKYFCEICIKRYGMESSWDNHLVDITHIARFNNLGKSRRDLIAEHECLTCDTVIFGDKISLQRHKSSFGKKKPKVITLPRAVLQLFPNQNTAMVFAESLMKEANKASENQEKEKQCCVALVRALKDVYPHCKAYPFGSRVTGLGYVDSDLDIFLDTGDMYSGNQKQEQSDQANIVNTVAKTLQKNKAAFGDINKVAGARTPIVQVFHKESKVDCDISFRHGLSVENTAFIRLCLDLQPVLRPTILLLKEWYIASSLTGLSSYALTMLAIFYLQTNGYLLNVKELRLINPEPSQLIDGWETVRYTASLATMKQYINKCDYTVIQLMENMFEYYAKFDFEKWVICPLMGMLIPKNDFNENGISLPLEMGRYVRKLYGPSAEYFKNTAMMCVQDPFDLSHNLTKACGKDFLKKFQTYCHLSMTHLSALSSLN